MSVWMCVYNNNNNKIVVYELVRRMLMLLMLMLLLIIIGIINLYPMAISAYLSNDLNQYFGEIQ
jgi:hypothetical protein